MKNKLLFNLFFILIFSITDLNAQTPFSDNVLDEAFLESLTPALADRLSSGNETTDDEKVDKLLSAETSQETNKQILERLKVEIEDLEKLIEPSPNQNKVQRFGESFFNTLQSTFMPVNLPNFDSSYIVDVGDAFNLMLTGKISLTESIEVQRDGSIILKDYGKIFIAGKSLSEVDNIVNEYLSINDTGIKAYLTLSRARDIQVLTVGGVKRPGIYTVASGSNILGILNASGGIASNGSFREIELLRGGKSIKTFDLYDYLIFGKNDFIYPIRSGDIVLVHPNNFEIAITGGINFPASYEMKSGETLKDLVMMSRGFSSKSDGYSKLKIRRYENQGIKEMSVNFNDIENITLNPRDSVFVPAFDHDKDLLKTVSITGMVNKPGIYSVEDGEKLSSLVSRAGGYRDEAYIYGSALFRDSAVQKESDFNRLVYGDNLSFIISSIGNGESRVDSSVLDILEEEFAVRQYTGRVITEFDEKKLISDPSLDITLKDQDKILIPRLEKVVYTFGDFKNPSNIFYKPSLKISDYVKMSGGLRESAYKEIIVIDPDGRTNLYSVGGLLSFNASIDIFPGTIIYAPRDIGKISPISYASTVAPILSSLAISLASLNSISD